MSLTAGKQLLLTSAAGSSAYQISRSLRFSAPDSSFLSRTPASAGNRKTWTWAGWVKRSALATGARQSLFSSTGASDSDWCEFGFEAGLFYITTFNDTNYSSSVYRDTSAWYHVVIAFDTTLATASDRAIIWVNNVRMPITVGIFSQNTDYGINRAAAHNIGNSTFASRYFNGYLADIHFIDGQALDPSSFTTTDLTTGQLIPKAYTGNYGLVPVTAATGGLPIFNTTGTYGTVKGSGTRTDTNSSSLVLALPMDGTNGGTSFGDQSAVIKGSGSAKTVTVSGATTSTALSKFYGSSGYFSSSTLSLASSADFAPGAGDFTVEFWGNFSSVGPMFIVTTTGGLWIGQNGGNFVLRAYNVVDLVSYAGSPPLNAWTHIAVTRQSSTVRIFFNGIQVASAATSFVFQQSTLLIGTDGSTFSNGYMQDLRVYNGVAKYTSNFSPVSGPNNSFHLPFSDNSTTAALGTDTSGNGNTWTVNNLSVTAGSGNDSLVDSPTNYGTDTGAGGEVRGNYCTWNPLAGSTATLSDGNLKRGGSGGNRMGTFGMSSGKWYWEIVANSVTGGVFNGITEYSNEPSLYGLNYMYVASTGDKYIGTTPSAYANAYGVGDVIGFAYDADNGSLVCYKNGVSQGVLISGLAGRTLFPLCRSDSSAEMVANFGQRAFAYTAPSGFKALVDTNLPSPPVAKPNTVMNTVLYTGNGAARSITGLSFNPDLVWLKSRSAATDHELTDSVRGVTKSLVSNSTAAEATDTNGLTAFNSDGFSLGTDTNYNNNAATYVAWAWDAGTSTVTNTAGSITSQVRANPSAGFSIVSWTGPGSGTSTVGHGLGVIPGMVFVKARSSSPVGNWWVTHSAMNQSNPPSGFSDYLVLNDTAAKVPGTYDVFRPHTSSVISLGSDGVVSSSSTYVAYCFAPVSGYSSFGSYTGNGSADGPFVYTGFRPRWIMIKSSSSGNWHVLDSARDTYNAATARLFPNLSNAEQTGSTDIDFTSTGFKLRNNISGFNDSGVTHVFAAFAESPFQYARAR